MAVRSRSGERILWRFGGAGEDGGWDFRLGGGGGCVVRGR